MEALMNFWYDWGVFVGVFLAAAATIYIVFDAQQSAAPDQANIPRWLGLVGLLLTLPSLYYRLTQLEAVEELPVLVAADNNFSLFFTLALVGLLLAIIALIYYLTRARVEPEPYPPPHRPTPVVSVPEPAPVPAAPQPRPLPPTQLIAQEPPPQAWLVIRSGPRTGDQVGLGISRPNIIGRDPSKADIIIDEGSVSREHARVRYENGQFVIFDMASKGGTYVNGKVVQRQMLYDNDRISLGRVEMVFKKV